MTETDRELNRIREMSDVLTPITVRLAATLHIADHILAGRTTPEKIAAAEEIHIDALKRVLAHMITIGLLNESANGELELTPLGDVLRGDHDSGTRDLLDMKRALGRAELSFVHLLHSVRTGTAAYQKLYGVPLWYDLETHPDLRESYDQEMSIDVSTWAPAIVSSVDWSAVSTVLDIGGGDGTLLSKLLSTYPTVSGAVLDLPATAQTAEKKLADHQLSDRGKAIAGSFFDPIPKGYGGYILTAIVHDWDDPEAKIILQRCAEAAGKESRVFVIEKIGSDGETPNTSMDLRLLSYLGGRERSLSELIALCEASGLSLITAHRAGAISILELIATPSG